MPVNIGNNLEINKNEISATQEDLFKKLNVAYGWTHTQTTSEGGTALVLVNNGDILTSMECTDVNKCKISNFGYNTPYCKTCIINGKIYLYNNNVLTQIGTKTDYVEVVDADLQYTYPLLYATDEAGRLWYINGTSNTETQVRTETGWKLGRNYNNGGWGRLCCAVRDGKMYFLETSSSPTLTTSATQILTSLSNITDFLCTSTSETLKVFGYVINNGYLYYVNGTTATQIGTNNNWVEINKSITSSVLVKNSLGEIYYSPSSSVVYNTTLPACKKIANYNTGLCYAVTENNKLYLAYNLSTTPIKVDISNGLDWTDINSVYYQYNSSIHYFYAVGDNKLYLVTVNNATSESLRSVTYTQIGSANTYHYLNGYPYINNAITLAWTGDATTVSHTILTTKTPQFNDNTYADKDLTKYSIVQTTSSGKVTDQYRTYTRDASKDTSFTAIPPETAHESISTVDFLRITNPNT